jgi:hypothetical protein
VLAAVEQTHRDDVTLQRPPESHTHDLRRWITENQQLAGGGEDARLGFKPVEA